MILVVNGEERAIGTETQLDAYAKRNKLGTYQLNYFDDELYPNYNGHEEY